MNTIKVASAEVALSRVVVQRHKIYTGSVDEQQRPYEGQKKACRVVQQCGRSTKWPFEK
jgi:hypothetical protein